MEPIKISRIDREFIHQVEEMSHSNLSVCWNCLACGGGCPFSEEMDYLPNEIIRMVQLGLKEEVLKSSAIWLCVGCNNCAMECPNCVDIGNIMAAIREIAIDKVTDVGERGILSFHNAVVDSIFRYGRVHKFEIMMRHKWSQKDFFSDIDLGMKMFLKGKLDFFPSKVKDKEGVRSLFEMGGAVS